MMAVVLRQTVPHSVETTSQMSNSLNQPFIVAKTRCLATLPYRSYAD